MPEALGGGRVSAAARSWSAGAASIRLVSPAVPRSLKLAAVGTAAGIFSGLFGVGGGILFAGFQLINDDDATPSEPAPTFIAEGSAPPSAEAPDPSDEPFAEPPDDGPPATPNTGDPTPTPPPTATPVPPPVIYYFKLLCNDGSDCSELTRDDSTLVPLHTRYIVLGG